MGKKCDFCFAEFIFAKGMQLKISFVCLFHLRFIHILHWELNILQQINICTPCVTFQVAVSLRGPGQSPVLVFLGGVQTKLSWRSLLTSQHSR